MDQIERLSNRWSGFSLEKRFDWAKPWRAKIIPNKQERQDYRLTEYGDSPYEALTALEESVKQVDEEIDREVEKIRRKLQERS